MVLRREPPRRNFSNDQHLQLDSIYNYFENDVAKSLKTYLVPGFASFAISGAEEVFRMVLRREPLRQNFSNDQHLQLDRIYNFSKNDVKSHETQNFGFDSVTTFISTFNLDLTQCLKFLS